MKETNIPGCPFCGGEATIQTEGATYEIKHVFCECKQCGARGKWVAFGFVWKTFEMAKREAIEHWSNRKQMERIVERLGKLVDTFETEKQYSTYCKTVDHYVCEAEDTSCCVCVLKKGIEIVKEEGRS